MPRIGWMRTDGFGWRVCNSNGLKYGQTKPYNLLLISRASWTLMMPKSQTCDMASSTNNHHAATTTRHTAQSQPTSAPLSRRPHGMWHKSHHRKRFQPPKNDDNRPQNDYDRLATTTTTRDRGPAPTKPTNDHHRPRMDDALGPWSTEPRMNTSAWQATWQEWRCRRRQRYCRRRRILNA